MQPPKPTPPPAPRALWLSCPKCGRGGDTFAVRYEPATDLAPNVGERLRVTCDRCGYAGYESCADARPPVLPPVFPPNRVIREGDAGPRAPRSWPLTIAPEPAAIWSPTPWWLIGVALVLGPLVAVVVRWLR